MAVTVFITCAKDGYKTCKWMITVIVHTLTNPSVEFRSQRSVTVKGSQPGIAFATFSSLICIAKRAIARFLTRSGFASYCSGSKEELLILLKPASSGS